MVSLPIPERPGAVTPASRTYGHIQAGQWSVGALVNALTNRRIRPGCMAHLDPDLDAGSLPSRPAGWRPLFGQTGAAETHLQNQGVGPGDLFLFFGWFRDVILTPKGQLLYAPKAPDVHVLFGWLQIAKRLPVIPLAGLPTWSAGHPHHKAVPYGPTDCIYLATDRLHLPGQSVNLPGAGILSFRSNRVLTAAGQSRSHWNLPAWFHPTGGGPPLSYHRQPSRWGPASTGVTLSTAKQGQEFVFDCDCHPQSLAWVAQLLR